MKINKRNFATIVLAVVCSVLMLCTMGLFKGLTSKTAYALKSANDKNIGELTLTNYDSTQDEVFDRTALDALYSALTGGKGKTLTAVADTILGTHTEPYGYAVPVTLPEYKTAADLFALNGGKNIVVNLNGQEFAVSFLTTDKSGNVIATLWMTQPLKNASGTTVTAKYGWATSPYGENYTASIGERYTSNAYGSSNIRMVTLNGGPSDGSDTKYALGTSAVNVSSLNQTVTSATRKANVLAPFTLNNVALNGTAYANKSLTDFITTPSQVEYTYHLDWAYASGMLNSGTALSSGLGSGYILNEALSKDENGNFTLSTSVGKTTTTFYGAITNGTHKGVWWNSGVYNYANNDYNHYNDWGEDYVWLPSLSEVGFYNSASENANGLWGTGGNLTQQTKFGATESISNSNSVITATTTSVEYVWLRSGHNDTPYWIEFLSSGGANCYTRGASLAVRPAIHLNLTAAEEACAVGLADTDTDKTEDTYIGSALEFNLDYIYNTDRISLVSVTGETFGGATITNIGMANVVNNIFKPTLAGTYELTLVIKDAVNLGWADGKAKTETQTFTITVKRKAVTDPPFANGTYNGSDQKFSIDVSLFKPGDTAYSTGVTYDTTSKSFTAVDADTYSVYLALADTDNYCWSDGNIGEKQFYLTIDKADLSVDFRSSSNSFAFERDASYIITAFPKDSMGNDVNAKISLYYMGSDGVRHNIVIDDNNSFDIGDYISTVGSYTLYAEMYAGTDAPDINNNYTITNASCAFAITEASAGFGSVVLQYKDNADQYASWQNYTDGAIVYNGKEWAVQLSLPAYMDIDGSYVNYYATDAGSYTLEVQLKIIDPEYKFDSSLSDNQFTVLTDKTAKAAIPWKVEQCGIDLDNALWEYSYDLADWYDFDTDGDPEYTLVGVYVRLSDSYLRSLGLNSSSSGSVVITYNNGTRDSSDYATFNVKGFNTVNAELTINDSNYKIVDNTATKTFQITAKQIKIKWSSTELVFDTQDATSYTWGVIVTNNDGADYMQFLEYTFVFNDKDGHELRMSIDDAAAYFAANASSSVEDIINGTVYVSVKADSAADYILTGADLSHDFSVGEGKDTIKVEIEGSGSEYNKVEFSITAVFNGSEALKQYLSVEIYSSADDLLGAYQASNVSAIQEYLNALSAGVYTLCITAPDNITAIYAIRPDVFTFEIIKQKVVAPIVDNADQIIYKAAEYSITDYLSGFNSELMEIDALHSDTTGKTAKDYTLTINLIDKSNYKFVYPETSATPTKAQMRLVLTDGESGSTNMNIASDGSYVDIIWTVQKFVITDSMFDTGTGNLNLPSQFDELLANDLLQVGYQYYADKTSSEPITELKAGETYYVVASLGGESANNFVFENPSLTSDTTSQRVTFKTPKSGFNAVLGNLKNFVSKTWLGLPIWAWLLIGLFLLILLIIIIAVACKRRKSKEEREEIKAKKEEERQRREEERQAQKERLEAERELAKAKQEAELEKIRAQAGMAGMGMAGAGMATMAMAQQPVQQAQQPVAQPVQQPMQAAQPQNDMNAQLLAEMRAQIAELRAENRAAQAHAQQQSMPPMPQYMPQPMQMPMPQYMPMPQPQSADSGALARLEAQINAMQAEQRAHYDAEQRAELAAMRAEQHVDRESRNSAELAAMREQLRGGYNGVPDYSVPHGQQPYAPQTHAMDMLGALVVAALKNIATSDKPAPTAAIPQSVEENAQPAAQYPTDAVITTTTTVDTTKTKPVAREREDSGNFDIDGFYDKFE